MKQTAKRFWNWHTLIVVLIISLLIAIVVFFKRCMTTDTADIERVGNEIIVMIDDFQKGITGFLLVLMNWGVLSRIEARHTNIGIIYFIMNLLKTDNIGLPLRLDLMRITPIIHSVNIGYGIMIRTRQRKSKKNYSRKCSSHISPYGNMIVFVQTQTASIQSIRLLQIR